MLTRPITFKLSALAALTLSLTGCFGGGSNPVQPTSSATATPAASSANGVSVSTKGTFQAASLNGNPTNLTVGTPTTDTNATLTTIGTIGKGSTGTVTAATITSTNATSAGDTSLTMTHGTDGVTIQNNQSNFSANNQDNSRNIEGLTATNKMDGVYANGGNTTSYTYMTFGSWFNAVNTGGTNYNLATGDYVYGSATTPANIPTTGTATYTGSISGAYFPASGTNQPPQTYADMSATADFAARSLSFATSNSKTYNNYNSNYDSTTGKTTVTTDAVAKADLNMSGTLTYSANSNLFAGSVADGGGRSGTATGRFYGPAAEEIGGTFGLTGNGSTHTGHFVGRK